MRPLILVALVALLSSACGSSPTAPAPTTTPTPTPASYTIAGTVTATNGGQALGGLSVLLNGLPTTTNGAGVFTYALTTGTTARLTLDGAGIVPRALTLQSASARTVAVQAISLGNGFDLAFYRQLVRNSFDAPATLQPLRRWTRAPSIYLRTIDAAGASIDTRTLDSTEAAIRETLPLWTSGQFSVAVLERGTETRAGVSGWLTVVWPATAEPGVCGRADVGVEGGTIELNYKTGGGCRCAGGPEVRPRTVRHELGHAMGFWHTDSPTDLMSGAAVAACDAPPSARELAAAAIAYARPVGNLDPDADPVGAVTLAPMRIQ